MENMKPEFDLHIQKSFSFTAFSEFKDSSLEFFSDDDGENDINNHKNDINNSYIEISLDRNPSINNLDHHLRISFSSSFPSIPESQPQIPLPEASSLPSLSSAENSRGPVSAPEWLKRHEGSRRRDQITAFNPLVHTLLFSLETRPSPAPETVDHGGRKTNGGDRRDWKGIDRDRPLQLAAINADVNIHRKASNNTSTTGNQHGIINKFKFRATKIRKLLSSLFTKSRGQVNTCDSSKLENDMSHGKRDDFGTVNDTKNSRRCVYDERARALEVNLGAFRGALEAMNMRNGRTNRRKTSSCPSSLKSSPVHLGFGRDSSNGTFFGGENPIQAAIAHCKSSLGQ